jgi:hypothetical protein
MPQATQIIVITTGLVRVTILLLLTASILTHRVDIAVVLTALFLFGVNETFGDTTTTTLLPMLVAKPDLGIGNSRAMTGLVVWNQLAGPPVGAALFAAGMALPFVSESVCVLAGVLLISQVRLPGHGARGRSARVRYEIGKGGAGCGRTPRCGRWRSRFSPSTSPSAPHGRCWFCTRASGWAWGRSASG